MCRGRRRLAGRVSRARRAPGAEYCLAVPAAPAASAANPYLVPVATLGAPMPVLPVEEQESGLVPESSA